MKVLFDFLFKRNTKKVSSDINMADFELTIFISPIWGSKVATPLRMFIEKEKGNINKYAYISLCNAEEGQKDKLINELTGIIKLDPISCFELSINELLPKEDQYKIKHTFKYRVNDKGLKNFEEKIEEFINELQ